MTKNAPPKSDPFELLANVTLHDDKGQFWRVRERDIVLAYAAGALDWVDERKERIVGLVELFIKELKETFVTREELEKIMGATQADIDAITTQVNQVATDLSTAQTELQAEIDALAAANPGVDVTALQAAVAPLDSAVVALGNLKPDTTSAPAQSQPPSQAGPS